MGRNKLKSFRERIKRWKPIHLCWLFEKLGLSIPEYLISAAAGTVVLAGSRIANATRTWQADEDLNVNDWVKTADFIYAIAVETEPGKKANKNLSIRWRNKTDGGSFVALSGTGELTWTAVTDLENDTAVTSGEAGCTPSASQTWMDGTEREGANDVVFNSGVADMWTEYHWAIDCSNAHDGDEYEFEIYSVSNGIPISTCASTITMESAGVTVSPTPASAISTALISAIVLGSLIISPTAAASIGEKVNPTVVLGSTLVIPAPAESVATTINPTVVKGSLTVSPNPAEAVAAVVDPGIVYGSTTATPDPASSVGAKADPTVVKGSLTLLPSPTEVVAAVVDPTVVISGLQITPDPASAVSSTVNPTVVLSSTSVTPTSASSVADTVNPTVILGPLSITPSSASAVASIVDPTVVLPSMIVTPDPVNSIGATENPTVIKGSLLLSPTAIFAVGVTVNPTVVYGSVTVTPDSASAIAAVVDPTVIVSGEGELVSPDPASAVAVTINPIVLFGSTSVTPSPASAIVDTVNPTVVKGSLSISPSSASAVVSVVAPTVVKGSLLLTPTPVSVVVDTVNPTVIHGSISIIPSAASAIGEQNNPVVILGSTSVAPESASAISSVANPIVVFGDIVIIPSPASVVVTIVDPIVILPSMTVVPNPVSVIGTTVDPVVVKGSLIITPTSASAVAAVVDPFVFGGEIAILEMTPAVISANPVAGGSLTIGVTYHFVVCGCGGTDFAYYNRGMGRQVSPPSNEVTFTADATNKSVEITLDTPADGIGGDAQSYWLYIYISNDSEANFNGTDVDGNIKQNQLSSAPARSGAVSYTIAVASFPFTLSSFSRNSAPYYINGIPEIQLDGGTYSDPITPKDIYDFLAAQGKIYCMDRLAYLDKLGIMRCFGYVFYAHINSLSITNHFKIPDREICIFAHKQSFGELSHMWTGNMQEAGDGHTGDYPYGGGTIYLMGRYAHYHIYNKTEVYNGSILEVPPSVMSGFIYTNVCSGYPQWGSIHHIEDSNYHAQNGRFASAKLTAKNINADYTMEMGIITGSVIDGIKIYSEIRSASGGTYSPYVFRGLKQVNGPATNFLVVNWGVGDHIHKFYDCLLFHEPTFSTFRIYYNRVQMGTNFQIFVGFSFNVKVVDKNNIPIQNAPVILKDKDENELINTITDVNGDITETDINILFMETIMDESGPPMSYCTFQYLLDNYPDLTECKDYRPFTLTVSPPGYEAEEMVIDPQQSDWYSLGIRRTIALQKTFIVTSIHSKASKSAYKEDEIAEFSGGVTLSNDLAGVSVLMEIRRTSDDFIMKTLLNTTYDFVTDVEVSYETLNGGSNPTWSTAANIGEFYFKILLSHIDLEGDKEDRESFYAGLIDEYEPELIELFDEMQLIEIEDEELGLIELE